MTNMGTRKYLLGGHHWSSPAISSTSCGRLGRLLSPDYSLHKFLLHYFYFYRRYHTTTSTKTSSLLNADIALCASQVSHSQWLSSPLVPGCITQRYHTRLSVYCSEPHLYGRVWRLGEECSFVKCGKMAAVFPSSRSSLNAVGKFFLWHQAMTWVNVLDMDH